MKKLMIVAAAALCATVSMQAVESANVVGYNESALLGGGQARGAGTSFVNVDGTTLTLGNLAVTGYEEFYVDGEIYAQKLNGFGVGDKNYYWFDIDDPEIGTLYGWYDGDGAECFNSVELPQGEGVWIFSPNASFKIQSSGQVASTVAPVPLLGGGQAKMVINPTPVTLPFGDVAIIGYEDYYIDGEIYAQKLNGFGVGGTNYYWFDVDDPEVGTLYGWYDGDGAESFNETEDLEPGEGLWIFSPSASYSVSFPAPEL